MPEPHRLRSSAGELLRGYGEPRLAAHDDENKREARHDRFARPGERRSGSVMRAALALLAAPFAAVLVLGIVPLALIVAWSFWSFDADTYWIKPEFTLAAYEAIATSGRWTVILSTLFKAFLTAFICLLIAYPTAYAMHFIAGRKTAVLLSALMTIPFFTSYLIRSFSWRLVLGRTGVVNTILQQMGLIDAPLDWLLFSDFAIIVGLVASYLPFATFPILLSMQRVDTAVMAAALDLGAGFATMARTVLLPLTAPGIFAGFLFTFVMVIGSSTEVQMLGGAGATIVSVMIDDVLRVSNFPLAFAISTVMLVIVFGLLFVGNSVFDLASLFGDRES